MTFERSADAERDHRRPVTPAEVDDILDFPGRFGKHHRIGRRVREVGFVLAVVLAHAARSADPVTEQRAQLREQAGIEFTGLVHGSARRLLEFDLAVEFDRELQAGYLERDRGGEFLVALDRAAGARLRHRLLDFALGVYADHFQELADAQVEGVFIHGVLRSGQRKSGRGPSQSHPRIRASSARVEESSPADFSPSSSPGKSARARFLPCSTPHWSKLFKFQMVPSTKTLCSYSAISAPSARGVRPFRSRVLEGRFPGRALCGASGAGLPKARAELWASALAARAARAPEDSPSHPITTKSTGIRWVPWCSSWWKACWLGVPAAPQTTGAVS